MITENDLTTERLLAEWRAAEIDVNGTALDTREHREALERADETRTAYLARLDVMKEDLRDG